MKIKLYIIFIGLLYLSFLRIYAEKSILPAESSFFTLNRADISKAAGKTGFTVEMSGDKFSEISWTPPFYGKMNKVQFNLRAVIPLAGSLWLKIVDADNEQYGEPGNLIPIKSLTSVRTVQWKTDNFKRCKWSKKGDGKISYPLKSMVLVFYPAPTSKGRKVKFNLYSAEAEHIQNKMPWTDRIKNLDSQWRVIRHKGAVGEVVKNADNTYTLSKKNGKGYIELRLKKPIVLKAAKKYFFRGKFQSSKAPLGSLLMFRFPYSPEAEARYNSSGDHGKSLATDCMLLNASKDEWLSRNTSIKPGKTMGFYPSILLVGNPAEVRLKDITIDDMPFLRQAAIPRKQEAKCSLQRLNVYLEKRSNATARLVKDSNGSIRIKLNDSLIIPSLCKNPRNSLFWRNKDFVKAGIPMISVRIPLSHELTKPGIVLSRNKYNWKLLDRIITDALRRAPSTNLVIIIELYEPWLGWGDENFDEIWQNDKGLRGLGNNCHLKFFSNNPKQEKFPEKVGWWPSYSSKKWQNDFSKIIRDTMAYINTQNYGKSVVGVIISGGDDGQFQYRRDDFSKPAQKAFKDFLVEKYGSVEKLNKVWKTSYSGFEAIDIPELNRASATPVPFLAPGKLPDYCEFQQKEGWKIREIFARAAKEGIGKDILTFSYGQPDSFVPEFLELVPSLDIITTIIGYPHRNNGHPYGNNGAMLEYRLYKKLWFNELDLRSWNTTSGDEFTDRWQSAQLTPEAWINSHRKLVGMSIAQKEGWWYFSMDYLKGRFFDASEIMDEIKNTVKVYYNIQRLPYNQFKPDVCIVRDASNDFYISVRPYRSVINLNAQGNSHPMQQFMFETSGVPMDSALLCDVLTRPELQNYKVYIFPHNTFISKADMEKIGKILKNKNRILIFSYSAGYLNEDGKSTENMRLLTGFNIATEQKYIRQTALTSKKKRLMEGVQPFLSFGDLRISMEAPDSLNIWAAPAQGFWIEKVENEADILARYTNGKIAGAIKYFPEWTSIYFADHSSISNIFLNNAAKKAKAYVSGKAGHSIFMNGNFVSIHPLYDDVYEFITPPGVREVRNAHTGELLGVAPVVKLNLRVGKTLWLSMTK